MEQVNTREIDACISTRVKSMYKKVKHRYIKKSVRQTCSKEGIELLHHCKHLNCMLLHLCIRTCVGLCLYEHVADR